MIAFLIKMLSCHIKECEKSNNYVCNGVRSGSSIYCFQRAYSQPQYRVSESIGYTAMFFSFLICFLAYYLYEPNGSTQHS